MLINNIKRIVDTFKHTGYRFAKKTTISPNNSYNLIRNPFKIPTPEVLDKICTAYNVLPSEVILYLPDGVSTLDLIDAISEQAFVDKAVEYAHKAQNFISMLNGYDKLIGGTIVSIEDNSIVVQKGEETQKIYFLKLLPNTTIIVDKV